MCNACRESRAGISRCACYAVRLVINTSEINWTSYSALFSACELIKITVEMQLIISIQINSAYVS